MSEFGDSARAAFCAEWPMCAELAVVCRFVVVVTKIYKAPFTDGGLSVAVQYSVGRIHKKNSNNMLKIN